ncbi:hypothetical protein GCM10020219_017070 [Nonomuraea dietziae]
MGGAAGAGPPRTGWCAGRRCGLRSRLGGLLLAATTQNPAKQRRPLALTLGGNTSSTGIGHPRSRRHTRRTRHRTPHTPAAHRRARTPDPRTPDPRTPDPRAPGACPQARTWDLRDRRALTWDLRAPAARREARTRGLRAPAAYP